MDTHSPPQLSRAQLPHPHCPAGTLCSSQNVPAHPESRRLSWHGVPPPSCLPRDTCLCVSRSSKSSVSHKTLPNTWSAVELLLHSFVYHWNPPFFLHHLPCIMYLLFKKTDFYIKKLAYYLLIRKLEKHIKPERKSYGNC